MIDGTDGSGKTTQFALLAKRLKREGRPPATFDFPQYDKPSSYFVREYLNGRYGTLKEVGPYRASIFYAVDRFDVGPRIKKWLKDGKTVISNRYVSANMGHQGSKIKSPAGRRKFFKWLEEFEYGVMGIPKPDLTLVLHVPAPVAQKLVDKKKSRAYVNGKKRDLHEADLEHLKRAETTYLEMVRMFPRDFRLVECMKSGKLLSPREVHERVWNVVKKSHAGKT